MNEDTVVDFLAIYRLTRVVIEDSADFPPLIPLRRYVQAALGESPWGQLLECAWCSSFWVALGAGALRLRAPRLWNVLSPALAASAVAGLLRTAEERGQKTDAAWRLGRASAGRGD